MAKPTIELMRFTHPDGHNRYAVRVTNDINVQVFLTPTGTYATEDEFGQVPTNVLDTFNICVNRMNSFKAKLAADAEVVTEEQVKAETLIGANKDAHSSDDPYHGFDLGTERISMTAPTARALSKSIKPMAFRELDKLTAEAALNAQATAIHNSLLGAQVGDVVMNPNGEMQVVVPKTDS